MSTPPSRIDAIFDNLMRRVDGLKFGPPVAFVYNPLVYAKSSHLEYWHRYGAGPKEIMLLGMNPGPWGMVQTGVPFGDVEMVTGWLGVTSLGVIYRLFTMNLATPVGSST